MTNLFEVDGNFHFNGDSTKLESYQSIMGDEKAELILADPPYCLLTRRNKKTGALRDPKKAKINHSAVTRFENVKSFRKFTEDWMSKANLYLSEEGTFIVWNNFLGKKPIKEVAEKLGLHFYEEFLWGKLTRETSGNETNVRVYEVALIFTKKKKEKQIYNNPEDPYIPSSVITHYDEEGEAGDFESHPNHKPFSSLSPLIRTYSKPGDRVLDPFTGSGSTPAACLKLERKISGIELRKEWADVSQARMKLLIEQT